MPQPIQMGSTPTEHQVAISIEKNIIPAHRQEEGEEQIEEDIELDNPEYAMTKENLKKITKEIAASRKMKEIQEKGKGKRRLLLSELEDEEELLDATADIIEDATTNKVLVETQFKRFVDAGSKQGRLKKVKTTTISVDENIVDLVSTPLPPYPT